MKLSGLFYHSCHIIVQCIGYNLPTHSNPPYLLYSGLLATIHHGSSALISMIFSTIIDLLLFFHSYLLQYSCYTPIFLLYYAQPQFSSLYFTMLRYTNIYSFTSYLSTTLLFLPIHISSTDLWLIFSTRYMSSINFLLRLDWLGPSCIRLIHSALFFHRQGLLFFPKINYH